MDIILIISVSARLLNAITFPQIQIHAHSRKLTIEYMGKYRATWQMKLMSLCIPPPSLVMIHRSRFVTTHVFTAPPEKPPAAYSMCSERHEFTHDQTLAEETGKF